MDFSLEFTSTACTIALVALGLLLLQRSHGIAILEIVPLASGVSLFFLSSLRPASASTLEPLTLILPIMTCAVSIAVLPPFYATWRLRIGGEPTTLLLSFAVMNCWFLVMSSATSNRSVQLGFADSAFIRTQPRLQWLVALIAMSGLTGTMLFLRRMRLVAALQLSKDDNRLLASFRHNSTQVRRRVLIVAAFAATFGTFLYISLQETFAMSNCNAVLIPGFAIAISQSRIRTGRLVATTFVLVGTERFLTQHTTELLRDVHQAVLFSIVVMAGVTSRTVVNTGIAMMWRRRILNLTRRRSALPF